MIQHRDTPPRGRVLIVDDQEDMREGMKALLELEGMDVVTHNSMITLPFVLRAAAPEVILLDLSFCGLSGETFFQFDRKRLLRGADATVLLFSGRPAGELAKLAEELGADGFVAKSQESCEIVARIRASIEQHRALQAMKKRKETYAVTGASSVAPH